MKDTILKNAIQFETDRMYPVGLLEKLKLRLFEKAVERHGIIKSKELMIMITDENEDEDPLNQMMSLGYHYTVITTEKHRKWFKK